MKHKKIRVAQFNIGHLTGPCTSKEPRKNYIMEVIRTSGKMGFFQKLGQKLFQEAGRLAQKLYFPREGKPSTLGEIKTLFAKGFHQPKVESQNLARLIKATRNLPKNPYFLLKGIVHFIRRENIDVLSLNEVDRVWPGFDQVEFIAQQTDLKYVVFSPCYHLKVGNLEMFCNGNAILSRYPFVPLNEEGDTHKIYDIEVDNIFSRVFGWGRRALHAKIDFGPFAYDFVSTHLESFNIPIKSAQAEKLFSILEEEVGPCVLLGDLNTMLKSKARFTYGDQDFYTGEALRLLEPLVDKGAHPRWFIEMFEDDERIFSGGTYPVIVDRKDNRWQLAYEPDRFLDYILVMKGRQNNRQSSLAFEPKNRLNIKLSSKHVATDIFYSDHFPVLGEIEFSRVPEQRGFSSHIA